MAHKGTLIVIEGIDGTGKTTQASLLEDWLKEKVGDENVLKIFEPTDSETGKKIRQAMMNKTERLSFSEELNLFIDDRKWNVKENIIPALEQGKIVVMDRYYFSTAAYQGCRGEMGYTVILELNERFAPIPDLLFTFILDVDDALKRIDKDRDKKSYMEKSNNLKKVQEIFLNIHYISMYNSYRVDASKSIEDIQNILQSTVETYLEDEKQ